MLKDLARVMRIKLLPVRATGKQEISLPQNALIIAPHPDDEALGCGGMIHRMVNQGRDVHVVILTGGEKSLAEVDDEELKSTRRRLALQAAIHLGLAEDNIHFLAYPDGGVSAACSETAKLQALISNIRPSAIFIPHWGEGWNDHVVVRSIVQQLNCGDAALYEYCVWMWYYNIWGLDWKNAYLLSMNDTEYKAKRDAMKVYLETLAPCGKPYSGVLPQILVKAHRWRKELYFRIK